ncbi:MULTISPECIES: hypothetical protein [unclassified Sphingomonas]|uniref:hypothetical protein n=1 Tax=unclassified Sphingomonas TaxID=196159 RepID=UPI000AA178C8|nr:MULTISPECIES: hypothetical protein [unclassified Sphingomonas]
MESISLAEAVADFEASMDRVVTDQVPVPIDGASVEGVILIPAQAWTAIAADMFNKAVV